MLAKMFRLSLGRIFYAFSQWVLVICIGRFLGPNSLGEYTYGIALVGPLILLSQMQMSLLVSTERESNVFPADYYVIRYWVTLILLGLFSVCKFASSELFGASSSLLLIITFIKLIESLSDISMGSWLSDDKESMVVRSLFLRAIFTIMASIIFLPYLNDINLFLVILLFCWVISFFITDISEHIRVFSGKRFLDSMMAPRLFLVRKYFAMGVVMCMANLNVYMPLFLLGLFSSVENVGLYSAVSYFYLIARLAVYPIIQSISPTLSRMYSNDQNSLKKFCRKVILSFLVVGLAAVLIIIEFGSDVLSLIYGHWASHGQSLLVLVVIASLVSVFTQYISSCLAIQRKASSMLLLQSFGLGVGGIIGYLIIPKYGVEGAGVALVFGLCAMLCIGVSRVDRRFLAL